MTRREWILCARLSKNTGMKELLKLLLTLVNVIETAAAELGSIEKACNLLKVTRKQYDDAKALLEKTLVV